MGSKMVLISKPGVGSTFYFDVSFRAMESKIEDTGNLDLITNVLIVDDNDNNRFILKELLAYKNMVSVEAKDGAEALKLIEAGHKYDAILMDYHMPGMDGIETTRRIKSINTNADDQYPVILLHSSSEDDVIKAGCAELKIQHRLMKPIKMQQLYTALSLLNVQENIKPVVSNQSEIQKHLVKDSRSLTIMIVEDNTVNLFLLKTILKEIVPNATLFDARNGKLAVDNFIEISPDLIFMDIQMPVMNGYDAALAIRELENVGRVPIVALTAGTVKGEKEKCLAAGMDDYVTKPIVRDTVIHVIGKWINISTEPVSPVSNAIRSADDLHFNSENLKNFVSDEPGFMEKILSMSKINLNNTFLELEESIMSQDLKSIRSIAHKMKGTALSACFDVLARQLDQLQSVQVFKQSEVIVALTEIKEELEYLNTHSN